VRLATSSVTNLKNISTNLSHEDKTVPHSGGYEEFYRLGYNAMQSAESQQMFRRIISPSSGPKLTTCFHAGFLLGLFLDPEATVPLKCRLAFNALYGVISQKIELFKVVPVSKRFPNIVAY
jgi:hypothetical protein